MLKEAEAAAGKTLVATGNSTDILDEGPTVYEGVLEAWRAAMRANMTRPVMTPSNAGGENAPQQESKMEAAEMPLENMQMAFAAGRPPTTSSGNNPVVSSYHPNAIFVGGRYILLYSPLVSRTGSFNQFASFSLVSSNL